MGKMLAIDFDGVLHAYSLGWQGPVVYDGPVTGALAAVLELQARGWCVVVFTAFPDLEKVRAWLVRHEFPDDIEVTNVKPPAEWYIDDSAIPFRRWDETLALPELAGPPA